MPRPIYEVVDFLDLNSKLSTHNLEKPSGNIYSIPEFSAKTGLIPRNRMEYMSKYGNMPIEKLSKILNVKNIDMSKINYLTLGLHFFTIDGINELKIGDFDENKPVLCNFFQSDKIEYKNFNECVQANIVKLIKQPFDSISIYNKDWKRIAYLSAKIYTLPRYEKGCYKSTVYMLLTDN